MDTIFGEDGFVALVFACDDDDWLGVARVQVAPVFWVCVSGFAEFLSSRYVLPRIWSRRPMRVLSSMAMVVACWWSAKYRLLWVQDGLEIDVMV
jgi:hypothetical protein